MKNSNRLLVCFLTFSFILISFLINSNSTYAANTIYTVNASTTDKSIGSVVKGQTLTVISKQSDGWYKIQFKNSTGFISSKYVVSEFTNVKSLDKSIIVDLRYNTTNNFTGKRIYHFSQAILRTSTAKKLAKANSILKKQGYTIKIWDAYRPLSAQQTLWNAYPNSDYVAKPDTKNIRGHQLGATIDMTICTLDGKEVQMQSKFDDFSSRASRSYKRNSVQEKNYQMMDKAMRQAGFVGYSKEWWHYSDTNQNFKPIQVNPANY
ncbi:M15 family metallopeptidase [Gottfriedia luciferensis]|uniref:M15 family metallopeptidase n=1 Tax=Gottfriedia luciferensis TaxID=178774 RepID=UPI001302A834|nr:M15 family metallopeptidase [Gottfriedia luciferensis]